MSDLAVEFFVQRVIHATFHLVLLVDSFVRLEAVEGGMLLLILLL